MDREETLDQAFRALGHRTRRRMLAVLARRGERTAGELGRPFAISQPTASRHLGVLEDAGLVTRRVEGRVHRFRVDVVEVVEVGPHGLVHRSFVGRPGGEVLLERQRRRAVVTLSGLAEAAPALGARPSLGHTLIMPPGRVRTQLVAGEVVIFDR